MKNLYVSTVCLKDCKDVRRVLEFYGKFGIKNVELGSLHAHMENPVQEIRKYKQKYKMNFIVHQYFPAPEKPFVVNLASQDKAILKRSIEQTKDSITFCKKSGIKLFSLHAGFRSDPDTKFRFNKRAPVAPYEKAFQTFVESMEEINSFAEAKGIKLAIENNVLAGHNLINGENRLLLMCRYPEYERFFRLIDSENIGLLLDLGHLNVTAYWLGFDKYEFIERLKDRVFLLHIHENDGKTDRHARIEKLSWLWGVLKKPVFKGIPAVIETPNVGMGEIKKMMEYYREETSS